MTKRIKQVMMQIKLRASASSRTSPNRRAYVKTYITIVIFAD